MSLKLIKPTWEQVASGMKISREGTVLLEFANALAAQQYNWTQKEVGPCLHGHAGACMALHASPLLAIHKHDQTVAAALRLHIIAARALVSSALHGMCSTLCCQPRLILEQCNNGQSPALGEKGDEQNKTKEMEGE